MPPKESTSASGSEQTRRLPPPATTVGGSRRSSAKLAKPAKPQPQPPLPKKAYPLLAIIHSASALGFQSDTRDNIDLLGEVTRFLGDDRSFPAEAKRDFARNVVGYLRTMTQDKKDKEMFKLLEDARTFKLTEAENKWLDQLYHVIKAYILPGAQGSSASGILDHAELRSAQKNLDDAVKEAQAQDANAKKEARKEKKERTREEDKANLSRSKARKE